MIGKVAVIGAGNGGKALAADLALQGRRIRLFEFPEYNTNIKPLLKNRRILATGDVKGTAILDAVTSDLRTAVEDADTIIVCTQSLTHERAAKALIPLIHPNQLIVICPSSTGGSLRFARVFRQAKMRQLPILVDTNTLPYGCRSSGAKVNIYLKVRHLLYGVFPGSAGDRIVADLESLFPRSTRATTVLEIALSNANPIIHPPIAVLNAGRIELDGKKMLFYRHGVSPTVAMIIAKLDAERMALMRTLGYPTQTDPKTCVMEGYSQSEDYFECYAHSKIFSSFSSPNTLDHRYFHEDIAIGLVTFCALGKLLRVETSVSEAFVRMGSVITGVDYVSKIQRILAELGIDNLSMARLKKYLWDGKL